jgi:insertion element IS1 protein InsB
MFFLNLHRIGYRVTKKVIAFEIGNRSKETMKRLWNKIKKIKTKKYYTDGNFSYKEILPNKKLTQTKSETYTIEGLNNTIRHYLARFHRKTHCYSKSEEMIKVSLELLFNKEYILSILS